MGAESSILLPNIQKIRLIGTKKFFAANKAVKGGAESSDGLLRNSTENVRTQIGNCFVAGTEILTTEGIKNIEDIRVGDWVIADDPTTPKGIEARQVLDTFVRETDTLVDLYVDGEVISTTGEHPFWVPDKGWVEAKDLVVGSLLQTEDGRIIDVDRIERWEGRFEVYNFSVEGFYTYFVSDLGVLVHNANCGPSEADWDDFFGYTPSGDAQRIARHAWDNHRSDFPEFQNQGDLARYIDDIITNPPEQPRIRASDGTRAYWDGNNRRIIMYNPEHPEGGTIFRPDDGKDYFNRFGDPDPDY